MSKKNSKVGVIGQIPNNHSIIKSFEFKNHKDSFEEMNQEKSEEGLSAMEDEVLGAERKVAQVKKGESANWSKVYKKTITKKQYQAQGGENDEEFEQVDENVEVMNFQRFQDLKKLEHEQEDKNKNGHKHMHHHHQQNKMPVTVSQEEAKEKVETHVNIYDNEQEIDSKESGPKLATKVSSIQPDVQISQKFTTLDPTIEQKVEECESSENETDFVSSDEEDKKKEEKTCKEMTQRDILKKKESKEIEFVKDSIEKYKLYNKRRQQFTQINSQFDYDIKRYASNDTSYLIEPDDIYLEQNTSLQASEMNSKSQTAEKSQISKSSKDHLASARKKKKQTKKKVEDDDQDEEGEDSNITGLPQINFDSLYKKMDKQLTSSFPFTNSYYDDVIWLKPQKIDDVWVQEIVALQCVFYMSDCHYYNLQEKLLKVNRMGTENYESADFDNIQQKLAFDKQPRNLMIDRNVSYTKKIKGQLMYTENREAKVEYMLVKFRVNKLGGMKEVAQSKSFRMDGTFIEHELEGMELQLNENGKYIFITQNYNHHLDLKIRLWDVETLTEMKDQTEKFEPIIKQIADGRHEEFVQFQQEIDEDEDQSKKKVLSVPSDYQINIELIFKNDYLAVQYIDYKYSESYREKFVLYGKDPQNMDQMKIMFSIDTIFEEVEGQKCKPKLMRTLDKHNIFPVKVFINNSKSEKDDSNDYFKILFIYDKQFGYEDFSGNYEQGYLWYLEDFDRIELTLQYFKGEQQFQDYIFSKAIKKYTETSERFKNQLHRTEKQSQGNKNFQNLCYILPKEWLPQGYDKIGRIFEQSQIEATQDFKYVVWKNGYLKEAIVYNETFSIKGDKRRYGFMNNIKLKNNNHGKLKIVRNQRLKNYCQVTYQGMNGTEQDTTCYCFFQQDEINKKKFVIKNDSDLAENDYMMIFPSAKDSDKLENIILGALTLSENTQNIMYNTYKPVLSQVEMELLTHRQSDSQEFNAQYPCLATNLGLKKLCIHINLDENNSKALIYDFNHLTRQKCEDSLIEEQEKEIFLGFVNYYDFIDVGLDDRSLMINGCSKFTYLTCKQHQKIDRSTEYREHVWLNLLIVDAFNKVPQVAHFKSKKVFDFRTTDKYEDVIKQNFIFKIGDEVHLLTQFPTSVHHSMLKTLIEEPTQQEKNEMGMVEQDLMNFDDKMSNNSKTTSQNRALNEIRQSDQYQMRVMELQLKKKKVALQKKLEGQLIKVRMFEDVDPLSQKIYFAVKNEVSKYIEIKSFDPTQTEKKQVRVILVLRKQNILVFTQFKDGKFLIIDENGLALLYEQNNGQLERLQSLWFHEADRKYIVKKFRPYENFIIDQEILIARGRIFYIHQTKEQIIDGILECEQLQKQIKSDYEFKLLNGPIQYIGQDQFINMYIYKDASEEQVFYCRQMIYQKPNSCKKLLINDEEGSCEMSTFLENEQILVMYGNKFQNFTSGGHPLDEIEFQGHCTKFKGDHLYPYPDASVYFVIYWHHFRVQDDKGINKKIFLALDPNRQRLTQEEVSKINPNDELTFDELLLNEDDDETKLKMKTTNIDREIAKQADIFFRERVESGEDCILVKVDLNRGLSFIKHHNQGNYWHSKCVTAARNDYFKRYELQETSQHNDYFMFFDNLLDEYSVWQLQDQTHRIIKKALKQPYINFEDHIRNELQNQEKARNINCTDHGVYSKRIEFNPKSNKSRQIYKRYPEIKYCPLDLPEKNQKQYIKKYLKPLDLESIKGLSVKLSHQPNSWANHTYLNILNNFKTKFYCEDVNLIDDPKFFCIQITFPEPIQISGFGFKSANNFPHLDPAEMSIICSAEKMDHRGDVRMRSFKTHRFKGDKILKFEYRSQAKYFLKENPWEKIKRVEFRITKNRKMVNQPKLNSLKKVVSRLNMSSMPDQNTQNYLSFQLNQIIILQKRKQLDYKFIKCMDLQLWEQEIDQVTGKLTGKDKTNIFDILEQNDGIVYNNENGVPKPFYQTLQKKLAFLNQDHVCKSIRVEYPEADEDEDNGKFNFNFGNSEQENKSKVTKIQAIFAYIDRVDEKENEEFEADQTLNDKIKLIGTVFEKTWTQKNKALDNDEDPDDNDIKEDYKQFNFAKYIDIDLEQLESEQQAIQKELEKLRRNNERFIMQQLSLPEFEQDTTKIYKNQERVRNQVFKFSELISVKFGQKYVLIKQSKTIRYVKIEDLFKGEEIKTLDSKKIGLKFPTENAEILEMYNTGVLGSWQIFARDNDSNILIVATWDIKNDAEVSMYQFRCDDLRPQDLFVKAIGQQERIVKQQQNEITNEIKVRKGEYNYILQEDTFIDLDSNIPFLFSNYNEEERLNIDVDLKSDPFENTKKIFSDSSRFLSIYHNHHLIFSHTKKDCLLWKNIISKENRAEIIEQSSIDLLKAFRLQFQGMSLFHHFASDTDILQLVYKAYIQARDQDKFEEESIRRMPLFILCPEDEMNYVGTQLAIKNQKPNNFEMMISMLQNFHEVCSSKMMLGNFEEMVTLGFGQVLEFFDKSQFNPPLMQSPFVIEWPEDLEQLPFASPTSLVNQGMLEKVISERKDAIDLAFDYIQRLLRIKANIQVMKNVLYLQNNSSKSNYRIIVVQALDFDWIFDNDNTENFIKLLNSKGSTLLYGQRSIKVFIELMWSIYKPRIVLFQFTPYCLYISCFFVLTSIIEINPMEGMRLIDGDGNELRPQTDAEQFSRNITIRMLLSSYCCFMILQLISIEIFQIIEEGFSYLKQFWNWLDMTSMTLNIMFFYYNAAAYIDRERGITENHRQDIRTIGSVGMFLMWIKLFYWMKLFEGPAHFITQIHEVIISIGGFTQMFIIVLLAFSNLFVIIQLNTKTEGEAEPDYSYVVESVGQRYWDALIQMYLFSLGDFAAYAEFSGGHDKNLAWIAFILSTFVLLLLFMNMIIAIMSEKFAEVGQNKELYKFQQQIDIINDFLWMLNLKKKFAKDKYILIIKPEEINIVDEGGMQNFLVEKIKDEALKNKKLMIKNNEMVQRKLDIIKDGLEKAVNENKDESGDNEKKPDQPQKTGKK